MGDYVSMREWVADWGPLLTLISTMGLLAVTYWYARLTRTIAAAAVDSAKSAETAAAAAAASASFAEASLPVGFDVSVEAGVNDGEWYLGSLTIARQAVSVYIHDIQVKAVLWQPLDEPDPTPKVVLYGPLPARLEPGHEVSGYFPIEEKYQYKLVQVLVDIEYSSTLDGPRRSYRARVDPEIVEYLDHQGC